MAAMRQVPREQLQAYFDAFSRRFLRDGSPEAADVEVVSRDLGDQIIAAGARLAGITYDPHADSLELSFELTIDQTADHRMPSPKEVWVEEDDDGFVRSVEVVRRDGTREIVTIRKVGLQRVR